MDVSNFLGGQYFSQTDLAQPHQAMTIRAVDQQQVGQPPNAEQKICLSFAEHTKPLGLNRTNLRRLVELYGTDSNHWINQPLLVYRSTTTYAGKTMLCVRVCGPQQAPPDAICDQQGSAVFYQPIAPPQTVASTPQAAPAQSPAAPVHQPQATAPAPVPAAAPQPAAPWEQHDQQQQNNPPGA